MGFFFDKSNGCSQWDHGMRSLQYARLSSGPFLSKYQGTEWILNDEFYFTKSHFTINENGDFYSENKFLFTLAFAKFRKSPKFKEKRGISESFIIPNGNNPVFQFIYWNNGLSPRLISFINRYHSDENYLHLFSGPGWLPLCRTLIRLFYARIWSIMSLRQTTLQSEAPDQ